MDIPQETQEKIARLQMLEQNLQVFSSQRQNLQMQINEVDHALKELEATKEKAFKVVGNLMVASDAKDLKKDLASKKEMMQTRISSLEKQEKQLKDKAEALQKEVLSKIKDQKEGE